MIDQMERLEKAREKEREKARVFSEEQERIAAEKQTVAQLEQERAAQAQQLPAKEPVKPTRTSPRRAKTQQEAEGPAAAAAATASDADVEMADAAVNMPPPPIPRGATPSQANRSVKRPVKPTKETSSKAKQAPTVIRVNTTSSQHSQFHPSNSVLASTLNDTLGPQTHQLRSKASTASLQTKPSLQSLKNSASSAARPKALELAAKRKEQEERETQRKREAKAEMERKRAVLQEEERRQEEGRRLEAQKQKEREREQAAAQSEAKRAAQRQAAIERAKQTRAPPPAQRSQLNGPPDYAGSARPPSRINSTMPRSQEELGRPVNAVLSSAAKATVKRPLQPELAPPQSYQSKDVKRMRMSEEFDEDELEMGGQPRQSNIKGPPVRPSGGFKKVSWGISVPHLFYYSDIRLTHLYRTCRPNHSSLMAMPMPQPARRGISSKQPSPHSTTVRPRRVILWTWLSCPRGPYHLHRTRIRLAHRLTKRQLSQPERRYPANQQRSLPHDRPRASRTATPSICPKSRRMTKTATMTAMRPWRPGRTRRTCAGRSCGRRRSIPCRSSDRLAR